MKPKVYRLDGRKIKSVKDFYREIGRSVNGRGGYFGANLDALADCLRGGFGTPDDRPFEVDWDHSESSQRHLGGAFVDAVVEVFDEEGITLRLR
ncbi:barstar family protein [Mycolicibacterium arenosum]|uniref:Barstar family protein n=1 Tax=Mycolicibacterium arenosum TaxID=2952157 RepID=A0ABT1M738_9MYCO|nr:barstar family protein [Mycolicibacterium sp. CAU 1645]MCP9274991.1 barstar family protein [Mycolicibacterium sp. CAU 1645]